VDELLVIVVNDEFTLYCCGPTAAPTALVACYPWEYHIDLLTIQNFERVITARAPTQGDTVEIFAPEAVWAYEGPSQHAIRALLALVHPTHPDAPRVEFPAPAGLCVSARPATSHDDPAPVSRPGRGAGGSAGDRGGGPPW
jgi:hypothetical protein